MDGGDCGDAEAVSTQGRREKKEVTPTQGVSDGAMALGILITIYHLFVFG